MARVALCNCSCDPLDGLPTPLPTEGPPSDDGTPNADGPVPPEPAPNVTLHDHGPSKTMADRARGGRRSESQKETQSSSVTESAVKARDSVEKPYDSSHKPSDIIVKASGAIAKLNVLPSSVSPSEGSLNAIPSGPSIRWERVAVSIYRFESKEDAIAAMEFIRQKALGESPPPVTDPNMRYITTREVGWTRPQDIRSPEVARILFGAVRWRGKSDH